MKPLPPTVRVAIGVGLAFLGLQTFQTVLLNKTFAQEEQLWSGRLNVGVSGVLDQVHRAKDDLMLTRLLGSLGQIPGVLQANVLDNEGHVGLTFSDHASRALARRYWLTGMIASALVWSALFLYLRRLSAQTTALQRHAGELASLFQSEKLKRADTEKREQAAALQHSLCLDAVLQDVPRPVLLMDRCQRIVAVNDPAAALLGSSGRRNLIGKSWQEVPTLSAYGQPLEESIHTPYRPIRSSGADHRPTLEFFTLCMPDGTFCGTWVSFIGDSA